MSSLDQQIKYTLKITPKNAKVKPMNKALSAKINSLPQKPGAYLFKDKTGRLLYVGKAIKIKNRVKSHFERLLPAQINALSQKSSMAGDRRETPNRKPHSLEISPRLPGEGWLLKVADIDFVIAANEKEALLLENELIKKYLPKYNIQWRDDKSYFWTDITDEEWPRIKIVHYLKTKNQKLKTNLIGPFTSGTELKRVLRALRKIFPYRTCKNSFNKPCLQWHLNLCPAHDPNLLPERSRRQIADPSTRSALSGNKIFYLESLTTLKQFLRLYANQPIRIEAYDISNIQGTNAVGSMIVFKGAKPDKSQYRKFKIKTVRGANDIAMLKEVLRRRLTHTEWPLPDIILIDGGRAQLNAAIAIISNQLPKTAIVALAKQEEEIYTIYSSRTLRLAALPISLRLTFQAIRNEAHRFAISYYRKLHRKTFKK